jgi:transcriptional regulator with XRE-family HTH domain
MKLGTRIANRMKELGLTQVELARKSGLTQQVISQYIRSKSLPGYKAISALLMTLEVTPEWFFDTDECVAQANTSNGLAKKVDDLAQKGDGLKQRVDGLEERVDELEEKVND